VVAEYQRNKVSFEHYDYKVEALRKKAIKSVARPDKDHDYLERVPP
jgi:hypothetical protein